MNQPCPRPQPLYNLVGAQLMSFGCPRCDMTHVVVTERTERPFGVTTIHCMLCGHGIQVEGQVTTVPRDVLDKAVTSLRDVP